MPALGRSKGTPSPHGEKCWSGLPPQHHQHMVSCLNQVSLDSTTLTYRLPTKQVFSARYLLVESVTHKLDLYRLRHV